MFYKVKMKDHIRVPPEFFGLPVEAAALKRIKEKYDGFISKDLGVVIDVSNVDKVEEGVIIPGDGASYYDTTFDLLTFKPEMQEVVLGKIKDITDFGAFMAIGPTEGMIHVSQTMDDFVSFSKDKALIGKESKRSLKIGDVCRAKMIAVSFKDVTNPKFGLTMRQPGLGRIDWIDEDNAKKSGVTKEKKK